MLPELMSNQNVYVEISNPVHGGNGWEFGTCLWSPERDHGKYKAWKIMESVKPNDIIIHLLKQERSYHWAGISIVSSRIVKTNNSPPVPDRWVNMAPYQRINLEKYTHLPRSIGIEQFFKAYKDELAAIDEANDQGMFFVRYGKDKVLRISQRYLAYCPPTLYRLFSNLSERMNFSPELYWDLTSIHTENEPAYPDYSTPGKVETTISRITRDTKLVRDLKRVNQYICQVCGKRILLPSRKFYCEGHHLKPLGSTHQGSDTAQNIIILCPFHHAEFDYGSIAIHPETLRLIHIDSLNEYHDHALAYARNDMSVEFLRYHYKNIFNGGGK